MAKSINFSYDFSKDEVRSLNEQIIAEIVKAPLLQSVFGRIETGVKNDKAIGFVNTALGLMLKAPLGCNPSGSTFGSMATTQKVWQPKGLAFRKEECKTEIEGTLVQYLLKSGIEQYDLTNTEYYAFFLSFLPDNIAKDVFRYAWFGDTAADTFANGGKLTNGTDKTYFNRIDGIWKQLAAIYGATAARKTQLTGNPNGQATAAAQDSTLTTANALASFYAVHDAADIKLRAMPNKVFMCTDSIFLKAKRELQNKGTDSVMMKLIEGIDVPTIDGIPVIVVPVWDEAIRSYYYNGTTYDSPHRILLTTTDNLALGFQGDGAFDTFDVFFDRKSKLNIIEGEDAMDAKVLRDDLVQVGI